MTSTIRILTFSANDEPLLAQQKDLVKRRAELRERYEKDLLAILHTRSGDHRWHIWTGGKRPRFCYDGNSDYINFDGDRVVLHACGKRETFATLEDVAERVKVRR